MINEMKRPSLEDVLSYENSDVVYRFQKTYGIAESESHDLFEQVKKWLWLANERRFDGVKEGLSIDHPIVVIDEMWHNFVLFTKEYSAFCSELFGYYIHHGPATKAEEDEHKSSLRNIPKKERAKYRMDQKRPQYEYIYEKLGKDTFVKWYHDFPRKYSFRKLAEMHLKALDDMVLIEPPTEAKRSSLKVPEQASLAM